MIKNVTEILERHPVVRFGLPAVAVVGCTLLFLFGISYFGSTNVFIAIGVLLLLAGYFCGWRVWGVVVTLSLALILTAGPYMVVPRVQWAGSTGVPSPLLYHSPDDAGFGRFATCCLWGRTSSISTRSTTRDCSFPRRRGRGAG